MHLSIVIVNWNTRNELHECLSSLMEVEKESKWEVIVVDNASSDGSANMVSETFPWVRLIASPINTGYARGNNLGFAIAQGEYVLTLNPDTLPKLDCLMRSIEILESKPQLGCLSVRLVGTDGKTQSSVRGFPTVLGLIGDFTGLGPMFKGSAFDSYRMTGFDYETSQIAPQPMGTYILFRRLALPDHKSPFDEDFPIFFNEVDLLKRMEENGRSCWYEASLEITHIGGAGTKQVRKSMIWESHKSLIKYLFKHSPNPLNTGLVSLFSLFIYIAAFIRARGYHVGFRP